MNKNIEQAFAVFPIPVSFLVYSGHENAYVTYQQTDIDEVLHVGGQGSARQQRESHRQCQQRTKNSLLFQFCPLLTIRLRTGTTTW